MLAYYGHVYEGIVLEVDNSDEATLPNAKIVRETARFVAASEDRAKTQVLLDFERSNEGGFDPARHVVLVRPFA